METRGRNQEQQSKPLFVREKGQKGSNTEKRSYLKGYNQRDSKEALGWEIESESTNVKCSTKKSDWADEQRRFYRLVGSFEPMEHGRWC